MYLEIFLVDLAVFRVFLRISRDFAEIPEFRGSATARNIRSPVYQITPNKCLVHTSAVGQCKSVQLPRVAELELLCLVHILKDSFPVLPCSLSYNQVKSISHCQNLLILQQ